jgi:hypothetical protein
VSERDAELLEIGFGQIGQDIGLDGIDPECRLVLAESEASQPIGDIHRDVRSVEASCGETDIGLADPALGKAEQAAQERSSCGRIKLHFAATSFAADG